MTKHTKKQYITSNPSEKKYSQTENIRLLFDVTRRDIEKSYNIENTHGTEAYYSNRYGWTLRRTID